MHFRQLNTDNGNCDLLFIIWNRQSDLHDGGATKNHQLGRDYFEEDNKLSFKLELIY